MAGQRGSPGRRGSRSPPPPESDYYDGGSGYTSGSGASSRASASPFDFSNVGSPTHLAKHFLTVGQAQRSPESTAYETSDMSNRSRPRSRSQSPPRTGRESDYSSAPPSRGRSPPHSQRPTGSEYSSSPSSHSISRQSYSSRDDGSAYSPSPSSDQSAGSLSASQSPYDSSAGSGGTRTPSPSRERPQPTRGARKGARNEFRARTQSPGSPSSEAPMDHGYSRQDSRSGYQESGSNVSSRSISPNGTRSVSPGRGRLEPLKGSYDNTTRRTLQFVDDARVDHFEAPRVVKGSTAQYQEAGRRRAHPETSNRRPVASHHESSKPIDRETGTSRESSGAESNVTADDIAEEGDETGSYMPWRYAIPVAAAATAAGGYYLYQNPAMVSDVWNSPTVSNAYNGLSSYAGSAASTVASTSGWMRDGVYAMGNSMKDTATSGASGALSYLPSDAGSATVGSALSVAVTGISSAWSGVTSTAGNAWKAAESYADDHKWAPQLAYTGLAKLATTAGGMAWRRWAGKSPAVAASSKAQPSSRPGPSELHESRTSAATSEQFEAQGGSGRDQIFVPERPGGRRA